MRTILGCTKGTSAEAMRYLLKIPTIAEKHKLTQVKAFLMVIADKTHALRRKLARDLLNRPKKGSEWMTEATRTIENSISVENIRKGVQWTVNDDYQNHDTKVIATLERECRE